jgi:hypothetical protein
LPPFGEAVLRVPRRNGGIAIPMDAFEVNKTIGAVLSALLVMFASKTMLDIAYKEHKPEKPGWALPITEDVAKSQGARGAVRCVQGRRAAGESQPR